MEVWLFVAGLLFIVLYCVVQVPAVLYISKYFELEEDEQVDPTGGVYDEPGSATGRSGDASPRRGPDGAARADGYEAVHVPGEDGEPPTSDRTTCAICGTENLPQYRYCQNCVAPL